MLERDPALVFAELVVLGPSSWEFKSKNPRTCAWDGDGGVSSGSGGVLIRVASCSSDQFPGQCI
jgi:hypothetical protein